MTVRQVPIGQLNLAAYNLGDTGSVRVDLCPGDAAYEKLKKSMSGFENVQLIVWNEQSGNVVGGHQRLAELDESAFNISLTDFDDTELSKILGEYRAKDVEEDEFDVDTAEEQISKQRAVAKRGDIWLLGENRLICGDSTDKDDFGKLMSGNHTKLCMTSPPYGVGKSYEKAGIEP